MSTYTGISNFQKTVRLFWPYLYVVVFATTLSRHLGSVQYSCTVVNIHISCFLSWLIK